MRHVTHISDCLLFEPYALNKLSGFIVYPKFKNLRSPTSWHLNQLMQLKQEN